MDKNFVKMIIKLGLFYLFVQRQRVNLLIGKRKKFMTKRWGKKSRNLSTRFFFFFTSGHQLSFLFEIEMFIFVKILGEHYIKFTRMKLWRRIAPFDR